MNASLEVKRNTLHLTLKLINGECFVVTENLDKGLKVSALHARLLPLSRSRLSLTVLQYYVQDTT
jgi:hypothetical protein